jgi:hypothetical protein
MTRLIYLGAGIEFGTVLDASLLSLYGTETEDSLSRPFPSSVETSSASVA